MTQQNDAQCMQDRVIMDQHRKILELQDTIKNLDDERLQESGFQQSTYFPSMDDRENWDNDERAIFHALSFSVAGDCDTTTLQLGLDAHRRKMWLKYGILTLTRDYGRTAPFTDFN